MKKAIAATIVLLVVLAALLFWWTMRSAPPISEQLPVEPTPQPVPRVEPDYPVADQPAALKQAPGPEEPPRSEEVSKILAWLFEGEDYLRYLIPENFIQRFVVLVDNLPRERLPRTHLPTRAVPGEFQAQGSEENLTIDPENFRRYDPFLKLVESVDPEKAVAVYARLYPRFQNAYEELGYPGYFNDRLVGVIDHLLTTPRVETPIRLRRPKIRYVYADPKLEAMSAGRKLLIRTGAENMARIKDLLGEYRQELVALSREE